MSFADLPPDACYVPELHLETYYRIVYDGIPLLMTWEEFETFAQDHQYEGEYTMEKVQRTREYYESRPRARI
jgi:hypothetical protein